MTVAKRLIDAKALEEKIGAAIRFGSEQMGVGAEVSLGMFILCATAIKNMPTIVAKPKWISVKDKLPQDNERVLCFSPTLAKSDIGGIAVQWGWCCKKRTTDITHWMSLPEPPKGE